MAAAATQGEHHVEDTIGADAVVLESARVGHLSALKDQPLLIARNSALLFELLLDLIDRAPCTQAAQRHEFPAERLDPNGQVAVSVVASLPMRGMIFVEKINLVGFATAIRIILFEIVGMLRYERPSLRESPSSRLGSSARRSAGMIVVVVVVICGHLLMASLDHDHPSYPCCYS